MDIEPTVLLAYAIIWTVFYFFLSNYIAELSRKKWTAWVQSDDSDDVLMDALSVIVDEIEDRMHDKLETFQSSFFGSLGAASKKLDDATGASTIKAVTKGGKAGQWSARKAQMLAKQYKAAGGGYK